ncbi:MAG TPA: nucleotide exchange factor GrpE [Nitrososphaerales archaeon]|nr:nucleotide exchange factor GrpE [Nitrososphaerales archaeon]
MGSKNSEELEESAESRLKSLEKELAEEKKRNEELLTRLKYMQADLENFRKRMDKELEEAGESLARSLVARLLVVQDQLDLAAKHAEEGTAGGELNEGIGMVRKNLEAALESVGVERIDAVGKPFDPSVHEAVEKAQGDSEKDMVAEEIRPGFTFRGQLLRPSMVKVELASKLPKEEKPVE